MDLNRLTSHLLLIKKAIYFNIGGEKTVTMHLVTAATIMLPSCTQFWIGLFKHLCVPLATALLSVVCHLGYCSIQRIAQAAWWVHSLVLFMIKQWKKCHFTLYGYVFSVISPLVSLSMPCFGGNEKDKYFKHRRLEMKHTSIFVSRVHFQ